MKTFAALLGGLLAALAPAPSPQRVAVEGDAVFEHRPAGAPPGEVYTDQPYSGGFKQPTGLVFDAAGRLYVWEKRGRVYVLEEDGSKPAEPLLDIGEEVADWNNNGLMSLALDPNYLVNGLLYAFYVVDHHHLENFGTASYDPDADEEFTDTISRVTRFRVLDPSASLHGHDLEIDPGSRTVLLGETKQTGIPVCTGTHSAGSLAFGADDSLLLTHGDGHLPNITGGTCLPDGILSPKEDVDNYRAQLRDSLAGKVLRLDPVTGDGLPDNPFYDPIDPRAPRSRVWSLGLRQPFRMTVRPQTGGGTHPGSLYIGEVGAQGWEELDVARDGGENFGWPLYEGMEPNEFYGSKVWENLDAPNPLFGQLVPGGGVCDQEFFVFQDLLAQDSQAPFPDLPNPCDPSVQVPAELVSQHTRPALTWSHDVPITLVPTYVNGEAAFEELGVPGTGVVGEAFAGNSAIGGVWYQGDDFPEKYRGTYFVADYGEEWIRSLRFDAADRLVEVLEFTDVAPAIVALTTHPTEGGLYYLRYSGSGGGSVRRITFTGNPAPIAVATPEVSWGPGPLAVQFDAGGSYDAQGEDLSFSWDFDDGTPGSSSPRPLHVFATTGQPESYEVTLTVTDASGQSTQAAVLVSVDNSPPVAEILTPADGHLYPADQAELLSLTAATGDAESPGTLHCLWEVVLIHDNHAHPEPAEEHCDAEAVVGPHTNPGDIEHFEVRLTVTDEQGLTAHDVHHLLREDDLNLNGFPDADDIAQGLSLDLDLDGVPDECEADCDADGLSDFAELWLGAPDCDANGVPDACDADFDLDGAPDACQGLSADTDVLSIAGGGVQTLDVHVGAEHAGGLYWVLGSLSGTTPGTPLGPLVMPLQLDVYFLSTLANPNTNYLVDTLGILDAQGAGQARIDFGPGEVPPSMVGGTVHHAALVTAPAPQSIGDAVLATNAIPLHFLP